MATPAPLPYHRRHAEHGDGERGIDQILPHPSRPHLFESSVRSATVYVELAEQESGRLPRPVDFAYVWGDALAELARVGADARIVNLETAVTVAEDDWPRKGIHYRMHPANVACLTAARIDCGVLANNHVLDWGPGGLVETLRRTRVGPFTAVQGIGVDVPPHVGRAKLLPVEAATKWAPEANGGPTSPASP